MFFIDGEERRGKERHTSIALIGVLVERAFGELEVVFGDDLVQGVFTTTDDLAGGAVANVRDSFKKGSAKRDTFEREPPTKIRWGNQG